MRAIEHICTDAIAILGELVAFDTTSRRSNLDLIAYVEGRLQAQGVASRRIANADGAKANLLAANLVRTERRGRFELRLDPDL